MRLATVIVFVDDVAAMRAFYAGVSGMAVVEETGGWVRLDAGGCSVALHALPAGGKGDGAAREDAYVKLAFFADDVAAERARLVAAGVRMSDVKAFGAIRLCDGLDPEGNVFQVSSRPIV
jgi:catechol 2,3-dioxygenase-like lactoylglutathione lyase family enzyme